MGEGGKRRRKAERKNRVIKTEQESNRDVFEGVDDLNEMRKMENEREKEEENEDG